MPHKIDNFVFDTQDGKMKLSRENLYKLIEVELRKKSVLELAKQLGLSKNTLEKILLWGRHPEVRNPDHPKHYNFNPTFDKLKSIWSGLNRDAFLFLKEPND